MTNRMWMGLFVAIVLPPNATNALDSMTPPPNVTATTPVGGSTAVPAKISPGAAEVIRLAESGVGDEVVLAYIQNSQAMFALGADDVLYLRDVGLSSAVITAMLAHDTSLRNQYPPAANMAPPAPVQEPPPAPEPDVPPVYATMPPPEVNYFYNDLSPYGTWVQLDGVGWCWQPHVVLVNRGWRPYCDSGHWLNSDCGWYWQSDYSWGWAPFHYGCWQQHHRCGWVWTPDTAWSPAWVIWRTSGDYCGWAPVPPHAVFDAGFGWRFNGGRVGLDFDFGLRPDHFTFVAFRDFMHRDLGHRHLAASEVTRVYSHTTLINNYTVHDRMVVNRGIPVERISTATHSEIRRVAIRDTPNGHGRMTSTRGIENGTPVIYRPQLNRPATPINVVAQRVDDRHPTIRHSTIAPTRNAPSRTFTAPRSPIGSPSTVPRSEIERRSGGSDFSRPRTYLQSPQAPSTSRARDAFNSVPQRNERNGATLRSSPSPQSTFGGGELPRQVPRTYSPKGYERSMESRPMARPEPRQSAPSIAPGIGRRDSGPRTRNN